MINFEEELARFKPSKEVEQAEDVIMNTNLRDMNDIMQEILKEKEKQKFMKCYKCGHTQGSGRHCLQ
mgnify:CR=1 FL=1